MPDTVKVIGSNLFDHKVTHVFLSKNIKTIPGSLFTSENGDYPLKFFYIPEGVTKICSNAFAKGVFDNITEMIIPGSVKTIEADALASLKTIVFMGGTPTKDLYKALGSGSKAYIYSNTYAKSKVIKTSGGSKAAYQKALKNYIGKMTFTTKKDITKATEMTLNTNTVTLSKGRTYRIKAILSGKGTNETVQWVSADTAVANISSKGTITGVSKGTTYVMAYTLTTGLHQTVKVTVK